MNTILHVHIFYSNMQNTTAVPQGEGIEAHPDLNPVDVFRLAITDELGKVTGLSKEDIFPALSWTNTLQKGDLTIAIPRFRIKGVPPEQLAEEWASKVCPHC